MSLWMVTARTLSVLTVLALQQGCGAPGPSPVEETPCDVPGDVSVELGTGTGLKYQALHSGDPVRLVFGSQAGMEAPVGIRTTGLPLSDVSLVAVSIWVDDYSIGIAEHDRDDCRCVQNVGQVDTPVLIDVVPHPSVASVVQLEGREATVRVEISDATGQLFTGEYPITITLGE